MNLKTKLKAYPRVSPSILSNYVSKEELEAKDYVTHSELNAILSKFVTEVENPDPAVVYGRQNGEWVSLLSLPEVVDDVLCYGMIGDSRLNPEELLTLNRLGVSRSCREYLIDYEPTKNGFFWFCCTEEIREVIADNGLQYRLGVIKQPDKLLVEFQGELVEFYCYRTNSKLVAMPGVTCSFRVKLK